MSDMDHYWEHHGRFDNEAIDQAEREEQRFPCACGDPACIGDGDDAANINLNGAWYAADCAMANHHPEVIRSREMDAIWERSRR